LCTGKGYVIFPSQEKKNSPTFAVLAADTGAKTKKKVLPAGKAYALKHGGTGKPKKQGLGTPQLDTETRGGKKSCMSHGDSKPKKQARVRFTANLEIGPYTAPVPVWTAPDDNTGIRWSDRIGALSAKQPLN